MIEVKNLTKKYGPMTAEFAPNSESGSSLQVSRTRYTLILKAHDGHGLNGIWEDLGQYDENTKYISSNDGCGTHHAHGV